MKVAKTDPSIKLKHSKSVTEFLTNWETFEALTGTEVLADMIKKPANSDLKKKSNLFKKIKLDISCSSERSADWEKLLVKKRTMTSLVRDSKFVGRTENGKLVENLTRYF